MNNVNSFNFIQIYGKNNNESHTPTTFDLYIGDELETMVLYKEYVDLDASNRYVMVELEETVKARYIKLVVKDGTCFGYCRL